MGLFISTNHAANLLHQNLSEDSLLHGDCRGHLLVKIASGHLEVARVITKHSDPGEWCHGYHQVE